MDAYCQQVGEYIYIVLRKDNTRKVVLHECIHAVDNMYANISARMDVEMMRYMLEMYLIYRILY